MENSSELTLIQRVFEQILDSAAKILEDMSGEKAAEVLLSRSSGSWLAGGPRLLSG